MVEHRIKTLSEPFKPSVFLSVPCGDWFGHKNSHSSEFGEQSRDVPLPNRVNKIRIRPRSPLFPRMTGDLSAMVGRVHQDMRHNISDAAAPGLTLGVLVGNGLGEVCDAFQVVQPLTFQFLRLSRAPRQLRLRPYRDALRDLF